MLLDTLQTIEQGTEVHVLLHKLCSRLIGFKCQLLNHSKTIQCKAKLRIMACITGSKLKVIKIL